MRCKNDGMFATCTMTTVPVSNDGSSSARTRWRATIGDGSEPCVPAMSASTGPLVVPVTIVTGDYFLDDRVSAEVRALGANLKFKPLWLEDLVGLAREMLSTKVTH